MVTIARFSLCVVMMGEIRLELRLGRSKASEIVTSRRLSMSGVARYMLYPG